MKIIIVIAYLIMITLLIFIFIHLKNITNEINSLSNRIEKINDLNDQYFLENKKLYERINFLEKNMDKIKLEIFDYSGFPYFSDYHIFISGNSDDRFNIFMEMIDQIDNSHGHIFNINFIE